MKTTVTTLGVFLAVSLLFNVAVLVRRSREPEPQRPRGEPSGRIHDETTSGLVADPKVDGLIDSVDRLRLEVERLDRVIAAGPGRDHAPTCGGEARAGLADAPSTPSNPAVAAVVSDMKAEERFWEELEELARASKHVPWNEYQLAILERAGEFLGLSASVREAFFSTALEVAQTAASAEKECEGARKRLKESGVKDPGPYRKADEAYRTSRSETTRQMDPFLNLENTRHREFKERIGTFIDFLGKIHGQFTWHLFDWEKDQ